MKVQTAGYPDDKAHIMTADKRCHVKTVSTDGKLITDNCIAHHGDSGGPLLSEDEDAEGLIIGVNSLGYSTLVELKDQSSSLLKNLEIGASPVFLPWGLGRSGCCEQTLTYAASSLGMRIRL